MKIIIVIAMMFYFFSSIGFWVYVFTKKESGKKFGFGFFGLGFLTQLIYIGIKDIQSGSFALANDRDVLFLLSTFIAMVFYGFALYKKQLKDFGAIYAPIIVFLIALSLPTYSVKEQAYDNIWFYLHIIFSLLSYAFIIALAVVSTIFILTERDLKRKKLNSFFVTKFLSSLQTLKDLEYKLLITVFVSLSLALITSSIWSSVYLGKHWIWDSKQIYLSLMWLLYGIVLQLFIVKKEQGKKISYFVMFISYFGLIAYWFTKHSIS